MQSLQSFDQTMKMTQVQVKQLYKEIKQQGDKFGEQVFNLEEKNSEFNRAIADRLTSEIERVSQTLRQFEAEQ